MDIIRNVSTALQEQLGDELDEIARECNVVQREREFTGRTLLLMLVITLLKKPDAIWADFHDTAARLGLQVSRAAVEKRFKAGQPLVDFFKKAFEKVLRQSVIGDPSSTELLQAFTAVLVGDATTIALPDELADLFPGCGGTIGTSRAALKLQILWDLKMGQLVQLVVEPGRASDAKSPIALAEAEAGTLLIYDLGYFDVSRFAALDAQGAKFISRLQHGTSVYDTDGVQLDLVTFFRGQKASLMDQMILLSATVQLCCRLVAIRVPQEVANRRRQEAREKAKKKGREPSAEYLELLGWSMFVTNGKAEDLTWKAVVVLYRARWQIETYQPDYTSSERWAQPRCFPYHQRNRAARTGTLVPTTARLTRWRYCMSNSTSVPPRARTIRVRWHQPWRGPVCLRKRRASSVNCSASS